MNFNIFEAFEPPLPKIIQFVLLVNGYASVDSFESITQENLEALRVRLQNSMILFDERAINNTECNEVDRREIIRSSNTIMMAFTSRENFVLSEGYIRSVFKFRNFIVGEGAVGGGGQEQAGEIMQNNNAEQLTWIQEQAQIWRVKGAKALRARFPGIIQPNENILIEEKHNNLYAQCPVNGCVSETKITFTNEARGDEINLTNFYAHMRRVHT